MIKSKIKIADGEVYDFYDRYGFIYMDADERTAPDEKECETTSYAEEAGEHIDPRTVDAPFDYTATFLIEAPNKNLEPVNARISKFNSHIRIANGLNDIKLKRKITFYNLCNHVKIVGYPNLIATPTEVYQSKTLGEVDFAIVELKIRVENPNECDFNFSESEL